MLTFLKKDQHAEKVYQNPNTILNIYKIILSQYWTFSVISYGFWPKGGHLNLVEWKEVDDGPGGEVGQGDVGHLLHPSPQHREQESHRRKGKGRRCWLGDRIECRTSQLASGWFEEKNE